MESSGSVMAAGVTTARATAASATVVAIRAVCAFAILPNVAAFLLARLLHFRFDILLDAEFLLLGAVWPFIPVWLECTALVGLILGVLMYGIAHTYYLPPSMLLARVVISTATVVPGLTLALWCSGLVVLAAVMWFAARMARLDGPRARRVVPLTMAAVLCTAFTADGVLGSGPLRNGVLSAKKADTKTRFPQLVYFPDYFLVRNGWGLSRREWVRRSGDSVEAASMRLTFAPVAQRRNVVLIIAESWGDAIDDSLDRTFELPYLRRHLDTRYDLITGHVPFSGSTVNAEARELCRRDFGFEIIEKTADSLRGCVPAQLERAGYRTLAVHGNVARTFDRVNWYDRIGFAQRFYLEDLARARLPRCAGAFPGICDPAIARWIGDRLAADLAGPATFVYWLSLNAHLPVLSATRAEAARGCTLVAPARDDDAICSWYTVELDLHEAVAELAARTDIGETEFVIVGDHAPPFSTEARRAQFAQSDVPYFLLRPKPHAAAPAANRVASAVR